MSASPTPRAETRPGEARQQQKTFVPPRLTGLAQSRELSTRRLAMRVRDRPLPLPTPRLFLLVSRALRRARRESEVTHAVDVLARGETFHDRHELFFVHLAGPKIAQFAGRIE